MSKQPDLHSIDQKIQVIKKAAEELKLLSDNFPAVEKNTDRILASLKMMEINISDVLHLDEEIRINNFVRLIIVTFLHQREPPTLGKFDLRWKEELLLNENRSS